MSLYVTLTLFCKTLSERPRVCHPKVSTRLVSDQDGDERSSMTGIQLEVPSEKCHRWPISRGRQFRWDVAEVACAA